MKSMSISVILDWIPDKYRIFYKSTGLDQLFRHARMLDDSMEIIDNDFLYLTQESSFLDREWDIRKPRFLIFCTKTGSKEGQINPSWTVSYTHLDVYKRQILYTISHPLKIYSLAVLQSDIHPLSLHRLL